MNSKETSDFSTNDQVLYIPPYIMREAMETADDSLLCKDENLGTVTSINNRFVFVRYLNTNQSKATDPKDLFFIKDRPDLIEKIDNEEGHTWQPIA